MIRFNGRLIYKYILSRKILLEASGSCVWYGDGKLTKSKWSPHVSGSKNGLIGKRPGESVPFATNLWLHGLLNE